MIATDGEHIGKAGRASCATGLASLCYDPLNGIVIDGVLKAHATGEFACACEPLAHVARGDLMLYDRNYNA